MRAMKLTHCLTYVPCPRISPRGAEIPVFLRANSRSRRHAIALEASAWHPDGSWPGTRRSVPPCRPGRPCRPDPTAATTQAAGKRAATGSSHREASAGVQRNGPALPDGHDGHGQPPDTDMRTAARARAMAGRADHPWEAKVTDWQLHRNPKWDIMELPDIRACRPPPRNCAREMRMALIMNLGTESEEVGHRA